MSTFIETTDFATHITIAEAVMNNKLAHLDLEFNKLMFEHAENLLAIESKVLMESGTEDDLVSLYTIEAEEVAEKGKGILASIVDAIRKLFRKIRSFLTGKHNENNLPERIQLKDDPSKIVKEGNDVIKGIKGFVAGNKDALKTVLTLGGTAVGAVILGSAVAPTIKNLDEFAQTSEEMCEELQSKIKSGNYSTDELKGLKGALAKLQSYGNRALGVIKAIPHMGSQDYKDIKYKNDVNTVRNNNPSEKDLKRAKSQEAINKKKEEYQFGKIYQLQRNVKDIDEKLSDKNSELKKLRDVMDSENKGKFGIGKSKAGVAHQRFIELSKKSSLTQHEKEEYLKLKQQRDESGITERDKKIRQIEKEIQNLNQEKSKLQSIIRARSREKDEATRKRTDAEMVRAKQDSVVESVTSELDALLESLS